MDVQECFQVHSSPGTSSTSKSLFEKFVPLIGMRTPFGINLEQRYPLTFIRKLNKDPNDRNAELLAYNFSTLSRASSTKHHPTYLIQLTLLNIYHISLLTRLADATLPPPTQSHVRSIINTIWMTNIEGKNPTKWHTFGKESTWDTLLSSLAQEGHSMHAFHWGLLYGGLIIPPYTTVSKGSVWKNLTIEINCIYTTTCTLYKMVYIGISE
jgi:hypothetical protein